MFRGRVVEMVCTQNGSKSLQVDGSKNESLIELPE